MIEEPKQIPSTMGGERSTHPAYSMIGASRVSGENVLFGSDFIHRNFIRLTISPCEVDRHLSKEWYHTRGAPFVEIDMSEAQWATFVSSLNVGSGVPATVVSVGGVRQPTLPPPPAREDLFNKEAQQAFTNSMAHLQKLSEQVADLTISKKAKEELEKSIFFARKELNDSLPFVLKQFGKHMETTTEKAKTEINAYAMNLAMRTGIAALAGDNSAMPPIKLVE